mmetsp:Transcript_11223/g.25536  ORF Transcript_11223/g.25536 Transcript_11223/m.25536 type:complete len:231 (+) Transcript_11223:65-757(+)
MPILSKSVIAMALAASLAVSQFAGVARADEEDYPRRLLKLPNSFFKDGTCNLVDDAATGTFETSWFVPLDNLVTYPCSTGYLSNLGANTNLLEDLKDALDKAGRASGGARKCGDKCDINNKALTSVALSPETFDQRSFQCLLSSEKKYADSLFYFCNDDAAAGPIGVLNQLWDAKVAAGDKPDRGDVNACECGQFDVHGEMVDFDYGCTKCIGTVNYEVDTCYDYVEETH